MRSNVASISGSVYAQMRNLAKLRRYLDPESCASVINSMITSRLDYNNSLLYGVPKSKVYRLQLAQNHAARLLTGTNYKGCPHRMRMRHVTEWIRSVNLSNSVLLHDLGHTGCVTGPKQSARHFRRRMRQFLQSPCAFRTELTHQTHAVKIVPCP